MSCVTAPICLTGYADDRYETVAKVSYNGKPLTEIPVVALEEVSQSGFFARMIDTVKLWFARPIRGMVPRP